MSEDKPKERVRTIAVDPFPKGHRKAVGGAQHDEWNDWLVTATTGALPVNQKNESYRGEVIGCCLFWNDRPEACRSD